MTTVEDGLAKGGAPAPEAIGPADEEALEGGEAPEPAALEPAATRKRWLWWALRIGGTVAAFAYIASIVEPRELAAAFLRVSPWAFLGACVVSSVNLCVGAVRWRVLLSAYGASHCPSVLRLIRVYWVGFFYNNYVPGGLGGDLVRGIVTRRSFGERGAAASMMVVLVERVLGLSGLLIVVTAAYLIRPLPGTEAVLPYSALGLGLAAAAIAGLAAGRRIAPHLPGKKLQEIAASLPAIERPLPFVGALAMSLITQTLVAVTGWFLLWSVTGGAVSLPDALVLVPMAMAASFFPLSVGGAGVREAAFVALCTAALAMSREDALAASLLLWFTQLAVAALGGISQLIAPLER